MSAQRDKSGQEVAVARLAANQHGVVSVAQLERLGVRRSGRSKRLASGRLFPIHRGVYAVGHPRISAEGRWMAAVLACGEGAVLSHISAAELWGIRRPHRRSWDAEPSPHVTVPSTAGKRQRVGIVLHRSSTLIASHCTRRDGIPVTNPARTLSDLRTVLTPAQLATARREAEFQRLPIGPSPHKDRARTDLEQLFTTLCSRHRLSPPVVNARVDKYEVDFLGSDQSLIAEVDGWASHRTRSAFEQDRARDVRLSVLGYRVVRFTWRQVQSDPRGVARTIRRLLGRL